MFRLLGILAGTAWLAGKSIAAFCTGFEHRLHDWDTPLPDCGD